MKLGDDRGEDRVGGGAWGEPDPAPEAEDRIQYRADRVREWTPIDDRDRRADRPTPAEEACAVRFVLDDPAGLLLDRRDMCGPDRLLDTGSWTAGRQEGTDTWDELGRGCGKSTLLNLLGGLDTPDSGEIWVGDIPLHNAKDSDLTRYRRHDLGIVFQFFNLLPAMTVAENVELPLLLRGERRRRLRVAAALELVDLAARKNHYPHQLSGGEMQRAAIARAVAGQPKVLLSDEPTGNLDSNSAERVTDTLLKIASQKFATLVIVTHSEELARLAALHISMFDGKTTTQNSG